jgi:hypothetical protein
MGMDPREHGIAINRSSMDIVEARHLIYGSWDMAVWGKFLFFFVQFLLRMSLSLGG